jgi:integrase
MRFMAKAHLGWKNGQLYLYGTATIEGKRIRKAKHIPKDDEEVGAEAERELNLRFAMGDLSWFDAPTAPARLRNATVSPRFTDWAKDWIESNKAPEIEESTWRNYRAHKDDLVKRIGDLRLESIHQGTVKALRATLKREKLAERTIDSRLGTLRLMLLDARENRLVESTPFDAPLRRRRTKRHRAATRSRRVTFQPFSLAEMRALLKELRSPDATDVNQAHFYPLTEALFLTGLRWAEAAAWVWPDVSNSGGRLHIRRAIPKYGTLDLEELDIEDPEEAPTKTGEEWSISIRVPLANLLLRQRQRSYVGRSQGWVFPNSCGGHANYRNWLERVWTKVLERSKVAPRVGDAQKAMRRSYITSALICGRTPKEVSAEVGHTTPRMVMEVYDSFLDPAEWPSDAEREQLAKIYGWESPLPARGRRRKAAPAVVRSLR